MSVRAAAQKLIEEFRSRPTLRAGSLIITVFGDAIAPRAAVVWVGSLIRVMAGFGINERLVRTSVFRLAGDGWLQAEPRGRRSYYGLTEDGARRFAHATERIYGEPAGDWDGDWCLVLLAGVAKARRDELRRQLGWLGFGIVSPGVLAHPSPDLEALEFCLERHAKGSDVVVLTGRSASGEQDFRLRTLAQKNWNLEELDQRYAKFVERFTPVWNAVNAARSLPAEEAFQIRTLLIQEYRKILLRDPQLPKDLLPDHWQGRAAYVLCRDLYRSVHAAADEYLDASLQTTAGDLPAAGAAYFSRFGGLQ